MASRHHLTEMCTKTKMCLFFLTGACGRGSRCKFAHSQDELKTPPDLRCTKLCPAQAQTGNCSDEGCPFAHDRTQLRKLRIAGIKGKRGKGRGQQLVEADGLLTNMGTFGRSLGHGGEIDSQPRFHSLGSSGIEESKLEGMLNPIGFSRQTTAISEDESSLSELESVGFSRQATAENETGLVPCPQPPMTRNKFYKTKMCSFFLKGKCKKGPSCNFAHNPSDMYQLPDLTCTKLCSNVLNGRICMVDRCTFAHGPDELRYRKQQQETPNRVSLEYSGLPATSKLGSNGEGWLRGPRLTQKEALHSDGWVGRMEKLTRVSPLPADQSQATTSYDHSSSESCSGGLAQDDGDGASTAPVPVENPSEMRIPVRRNSVARVGIQEPSGPKSPLSKHAPADSQAMPLSWLPGMRPGIVDGAMIMCSSEPAKKWEGRCEDQQIHESTMDADPETDVHRRKSRFAKLEKHSHSFDDSVNVCVKNTFIEVREADFQPSPLLVRSRSSTF